MQQQQRRAAHLGLVRQAGGGGLRGGQQPADGGEVAAQDGAHLGFSRIVCFKSKGTE